MNINDTLAERGARYGVFADHAVISQCLQDKMREAPGWQRLAPDQKQALSTIADKIARMLNGDPNYIDNWHDIIGYAKLIEDRLAKAQEPVEQANKVVKVQFPSIKGLKVYSSGEISMFPDKNGYYSADDVRAALAPMEAITSATIGAESGLNATSPDNSPPRTTTGVSLEFRLSS